MLRLRAPFMPGETATGLCARLSIRNACRNARDFCRLLGLRFQKIVDGDPEALTDLADLSGVDPETMVAGAIRKLDSSRFCWNGQILMKPMLRRAMVRICPQCLRADLEQRPDLGPVAAWQRAEWLLSTFRRCPIHGTALIAIAKQEYCGHVHDFHLAVLSRLDNLLRWESISMTLQPSRFENYVRERLQGLTEASSNWLNRLPFYAAIKLCEAVGIAEHCGPKTRWESVSEPDMHAACDKGYAVLHTGPKSIEAWVDKMAEPFWATSRATGPNALFGELYSWLAYKESDTAYAPFKEIVRERLLDLLPFEPGEEVMGRPVKVRRMWSVHAAVKATGRHRKHLRKLLAQDGLIPDETGHRSDNRIVFPADAAAKEFLTKMTGAMLLHQVGKYIGAPRMQMQGLVQNGFLLPFREKRLRNIHRRVFAKSDADEFLARLLADAMIGDLRGFSNIPTAVKKSATSAAFVVQLLLDRKLKKIRRDPAAHGFLSVMVDPEEVKQHSADDHATKPLSARQASKLTHWSYRIFKLLVSHGHLNGSVAGRCTIIDRQSLATFTSTFIPLHDIAAENGLHFLAVKKSLDENGVFPEFDPKVVKATFYRRENIRGIFPPPPPT